MAAAAYTRMALVRPDLLENKTPTTPTQTLSQPQTLSPPPESSQLPDAQSAFYESQLVRERLSPDNSLVNILTHLQKKAFNVLHDESLTASAKLVEYNQLMVQSSIMMKKAKAIGREVGSMNPATLRRPFTTAKRRAPRDKRVTPPPTLATSDSEDDYFEDTRLPDSQGDAGLLDTATGGVEEDEIAEERNLRKLDFDIDRKVPTSYAKKAKQLYKLLLAKDEHGILNWNNKGELVVHGNTVEDSDLVELLADAAKPRSQVSKRAPVGRSVFIKLVKRLNPTLTHVKNKEVFATTGSRSSFSAAKRRRKSPTGKASKGQTGRGLNIVWRTKL